jgi:cyclohexa-1,5-dienecarbonyl-CoA hydratase
MGLVTRLVTEHDADSELERALASLREKSAAALRMTKRAVLRGRRATFRELVSPAEDVYLDQLMGTQDSVEGLEAFLEKRQPVWQHV